MPEPEQVAAANYLAQQQLELGVAAAVQRLWSQMDPVDFDGSWARIGRLVLALLVAAQAQAASSAVQYVTDALDAQGLSVPPTADLIAAALTGVASSGAPLDVVADTARIVAKVAVGEGSTAEQALQVGGRLLRGITVTQLADANRVATGVAIATRPGVGYVRHLVLPSCKRCVILAGRFYQWNAGFLRHPRCDCRHVPSTRKVEGDVRFDPNGYVDSLSTQACDALLGPAGARAYEDGADLRQVVNADRGMTTASIGKRPVRITTEGATRRGVAGRRLQSKPRLMPDQIYEIAGNNRGEALRLLERNGYIR